jgi:hypothetical protein
MEPKPNEVEEGGAVLEDPPVLEEPPVEDEEPEEDVGGDEEPEELEEDVVGGAAITREVLNDEAKATATRVRIASRRILYYVCRLFP